MERELISDLISEIGKLEEQGFSKTEAIAFFQLYYTVIRQQNEEQFQENVCDMLDRNEEILNSVIGQGAYKGINHIRVLTGKAQ